MPSDQYHVDEVLNSTPGELLLRLKEIATFVTHAAEAESLELVLERIAKVSAELVQARYAALGVPDGMGGLRFFKVTGLTPEQIREIDHPPVGRGLLGAIMNETEVIRLPHMRTDPRSSGFPAGHPPMESLLGVPITMGEQLFGMLYLTDRLDGQPFTEQDQWLIEVMASYAALAINNAQLLEQRSRLVMLEERERIGMELHDGIIQSIYAIGMQVDLVANTQGEKQAQGLRSVINGLNTVIEDIRSYIQNLRTMGQSQDSLRECLDEILSRMHIPERMQVTINVPDDQTPPLASAAFDAVCQIVHEALSNAVRHANASHVEIRSSHDNDVFALIVEDDGAGFDITSESNHNGLGLRNIQQRARLHGGQVLIDSQRGQGTRITISIPTTPR
jgi:signal transduction histidine kinase